MTLTGREGLAATSTQAFDHMGFQGRLFHQHFNQCPWPVEHLKNAHKSVSQKEVLYQQIVREQNQLIELRQKAQPLMMRLSEHESTLSSMGELGELALHHMRTGRDCRSGYVSSELKEVPGNEGRYSVPASQFKSWQSFCAAEGQVKAEFCRDGGFEMEASEQDLCRQAVSSYPELSQQTEDLASREQELTQQLQVGRRNLKRLLEQGGEMGEKRWRAVLGAQEKLQGQVFLPSDEGDSYLRGLEDQIQGLSPWSGSEKETREERQDLSLQWMSGGENYGYPYVLQGVYGRQWLGLVSGGFFCSPTF